MGRKKRPAKDYHALAMSRGFDWLGPEVGGVVYDTEWQCQSGHKWNARFDCIQRGTGCPYCLGRGHKSIKDYHDLANKRGFIWLGSEEAKTKTKTKWQCQKGHTWEVSFAHILQGSGCPYCSSKARKLPDDYHSLATRRGFIWLGPEVFRNNTKTGWQCQKGHIWEATYGKIYQYGNCPYCVGLAPKSTEDYHNLAKDRGFIWLGPEVYHTKAKTRWQCERGHEWEAPFNGIGNGRGCPFCRQSYSEETIAKFLNSYGISYNRGKQFDKCRDKNPLLFDFYFHLSQNHFLVEYDGIQHFESIKAWGGESKLKDRQAKDFIKTQFAQDNNFILIRIPYTIKSIEAYLQFELEKHLSFPLNQLKNQPERPQPKIKPINPYQWRQGILL